LGVSLMRAIRERLPQARFVGMPGPTMQKAGCRSLADFNAMSMIGLVEILTHLPRLLKLRRRLISDLVHERPAIVIGIDAPDFMLGLERRCREAGLRTVHYVSPSVWAWRPRRIRTVARAVELVLCLLPFEPACYRTVDVRAEFVGHPLADELSPRPAAVAREALGLEAAGRVLAVLPGSRGSELTRLLPSFLGAANELSRTRADLQVVIPVARPELRSVVEAACSAYPDLTLRLIDGRAHEVVAAADAVLVASGTATLETLLLDRPMVVAYRMAPLSAWLLLRAGLLRTPYFALPNLILGREIVPELAQSEASIDKITGSLAPLLDGAKAREAQLAAFAEVRETLGHRSARHAADLIVEWMERDDEEPVGLGGS
ncbi:MAG: lipid-A-disaccharide synthase, partial [Gammaproteobacteria bacterium]